MLGSEILDVGIGLVMMFLLVSLVCSSIKEGLETVLNHRSKDLERGLREMLGDIKREHVIPALYKHPLIDGLYKGEYLRGKTRNLPSYIPSRTFALALIDLVAQGTDVLSSKPGEEVVRAHTQPTMGGFEATLMKLPVDSRLRGSLLPIMAVAAEDGARLQAEIERWYDATMDRVSGWYKKRTQIILAGIGLSLAIAMNMDTVAIVRYLNTNQTARQMLISRAEKFREVNSEHLPKNEPSELVDPLGWLERQGGVPLGWMTHPLPQQSDVDFQHDWRRVPDSLSSWLFKIAGILFTGFAVTMGAPFWFDVLNRFMVVRSTVKPDEKSPNEPSKA